MDVLQRGGSAADAAVAVQAALGLVEPQSSGIGGGAFMTYYDARTAKVTVYDGRETAPAGATPTMFIGPDGKPLPFATAVLSGRATGVPGAVRMLETAQRAHGRLRWSELFEPTAVLAEQGFQISPRLGRMLGGNYPQLSAPDVVKYFSKPDGTKLKVGDTLQNPVYARFLRRLASGGANVLYTGETAARIVERVRQGPFESSMTMADLSRYRPVKREALCRAWQSYTACVPPPPSSGVSTLQLLEMLGRTDIASRGPSDPQGWYLFAEASRLMYADRDRYVADPAFVKVPVEGLLDPAYVASRAALIGPTAGAAAGRRNPAGRGAGGRRPHAGAGRDQPFHRRRQRWQRRQHDHHGGKHLRLGPDGRRLFPQQPDDRFQLLADRGRRPARRQCGGGGQAAALVDDAADPARRAGALRRRVRKPGRKRDPGLCRQDAWSAA